MTTSGSDPDTGVTGWPQAPTGASSATLPEPPETGDPAVDAVVLALAATVEEPLQVQVEAFDRAHRMLQDRLSDVEG